MTWAEWMRALLAHARRRTREIQDYKLQAYLVAVLVRRKDRLPPITSWLAEHKTRPVYGAEREQLRAERKALETELGPYLERMRVEAKRHGNKRSTR